MRRRLLVLVAAATGAVVCSAAAAAPAGVDVRISLTASTAYDDFARGLPSGQTVPVFSRNFVVYLFVEPRPVRAKLRVELGEGLRWRADGSDPGDPGEGCTSTPSSAECDVSVLTGGSVGWFWDVVAPQDGRYTYRATVTEASEPDPDASNNSASITIAVTEPSGGSGGGGSGGGGAAAVSAGSVKLSPARPKAGSTLVASVRVTRGGSPVRPTGVACAATIGGAKAKGGPKSASGVASCLFRTPRSAKGKRIAGTVSFRAGGESFTRRFSARLG